MTETLSERHEREFASIVPETHQTLASGAVLGKHDAHTVQTETNEAWRFRYELKCTQQKSYSLKVKEWQDVVEYAALQGERPAWAVRWYPKTESEYVPVLADVVMCDLNDWVEMLAELVDLRERVAKIDQV